MVNIGIYMENKLKHGERWERRFNSPLPVRSIGFIPAKPSRTLNTFETYNYSFIIEGNGYYHVRGRRHAVAAPCVITQWPGEPMDYGPDETWNETYLIYPERCGDYLKSRGFFKEHRFMWRIADVDLVRDMLRRLSDMLRREEIPDRIDLFCESIILESLLGAPSGGERSVDPIIDRVRAELNADLSQRHDVRSIAAKHAMSLSTFRRRWLKRVGVPVGRYLTKRRVDDAARLLVETDSSVGEIADAVGFDDPLYFSKVFRKTTGQTATGYRRRHQMPR